MEMKMNELRLDFGDDILFNENCFARAFGGAGGSVNAGGDAPPDPPSVGDVMGPFPLSLFSSRKDFWRMSGIIFFGKGVKNYKKPHKSLTAGLVPLVST